MKKSTIWYLTTIMALAILGLLYVQLMYMKNMVTMREDQFTEGVKRSLYAVTTRLEQDEARHYLEEDIAKIDAQFDPLNDGSNTETLKYNFTTPEGIHYDIVQKKNYNEPTIKFQSMHEVIRGQYLYQKGLLDEVILNIITQSSSRPVSERADSSLVRTYLASEFANNGLYLPFEFAVTNRIGAQYYATSGFTPEPDAGNSLFIQPLFPNDPQNRMPYLRVFFPSKHHYIQDSVKFMIPSFIFTFLLLVTFVAMIIVAFRQKKLTEMKNDFINNMTHEFKTPISSISLAAQMLNDDAVLKSPTMLSHISTVINDETKRLRFQVEKVLQMSMFERQKATMRLTELDANNAIEGIARTFKLKVEKYGGTLTTLLNASDSVVMVDEMHFTNVIFNLLDNAVKYRREDVPLSLRISTADITDNRLKITIADNGIGIKREDLKKIFEKFYRVSTGNRHDVKGFGLGLAYVKKMVNELGGNITVESEPGQGTTFIITLPLAG